jgi:hypothetical protein
MVGEAVEKVKHPLPGHGFCTKLTGVPAIL